MTTYYRGLVDGNCYFHIFEKDGHIMFYENPEEFNRVILEFVEGYQKK
jgi:pimeloyl-ACP methyl ester carboxylesterase